MVQIRLIVSLAFLPYLSMALENSNNHMYGDCLHSKGPRFSPSPQWPDSPHMAGASMLVFRCTVNTTLTPSFNVTWTKDGEVIQPSDHARFEMENQVLNIWPPLINSDQGLYACTVRDGVGQTCTYSRYETVVPVTPADAPSIVGTSPVNGVKAVSLGDSTQISCTMTIGSSLWELGRWWKRNGTKLNDTSHYTWDNLSHENGRRELILNITNVTSEDFGEYTCVAENSYGTDNRTITLQQYQPDAGEVLSTWQIAVIAAGGGLVIVLLVVVMVIRVKCRKDAVDWPLLDPENYDVPGYQLEYDVFISYSSEDEEWVKSKLFTELLNMGYNVNIDFKDFVPGMAIAENVMDSIYKSRKTIVLMSKNFLRSMWGQFELQQAHNKAIAQRKDVLILIKYDKCKVPGKLMGKTFLDWTDTSIQPHFWQRLQDAIGDPVNYAEINQRPVPADQLPVPADQLPVPEDQLPVPADQLPVTKQDNKNTDEVKVDKENKKNLENNEENVHMRQKKKRQKMEECDQMNEEDMEGMRMSQEERMQLII
ncbi:interleukin-18 receptor accessory protein-like [Pecten maximus]|uniref:interleukin-18 receptor accessory protein-like n=1 Tax=Pecten maximus TaxID=6579 RepID=UPI001458DCC9|nr:interleukin-18 receptor accessory protein-like [Pecten maximus]